MNFQAVLVNRSTIKVMVMLNQAQIQQRIKRGTLINQNVQGQNNQGDEGLEIIFYEKSLLIEKDYISKENVTKYLPADLKFLLVCHLNGRIILVILWKNKN